MANLESLTADSLKKVCDLFNVSKIGEGGKEARAQELWANIQAQLEHTVTTASCMKSYMRCH